MKSVSRALSLLSQFSENPEPKALGVIAADAGFDKATTRRMLVSMLEFGLIEQDPNNRKYTLGPGILPLARAREKQYPILPVAEKVIYELAEETGETTHFSVHVQNSMTVLRVAESMHAVRVHVPEGSVLPLHTSGAGIAYLSACDDATIDTILSVDLKRYTRNSYASAQAVRDSVKEAKALGYAQTAQTFEAGVFGIAMPVHRGDGMIAGVIGVATPSERTSAQAINRVVGCLKPAVARMESLI